MLPSSADSTAGRVGVREAKHKELRVRKWGALGERVGQPQPRALRAKGPASPFMPRAVPAAARGAHAHPHPRATAVQTPSTARFRIFRILFLGRDAAATATLPPTFPRFAASACSVTFVDAVRNLLRHVLGALEKGLHCALQEARTRALLAPAYAAPSPQPTTTTTTHTHTLAHAQPLSRGRSSRGAGTRARRLPPLTPKVCSKQQCKQPEVSYTRAPRRCGALHVRALGVEVRSVWHVSFSPHPHLAAPLGRPERRGARTRKRAWTLAAKKRCFFGGRRCV